MSLFSWKMRVEVRPEQPPVLSEIRLNLLICVAWLGQLKRTR